MPVKKSTSAVDVAAGDPDEFAFLSGIAADMRVDLPKSVYADWLEERGDDKRATFLRNMVAATSKLKKGTKLPASRTFPRAWRNMVGEPLYKGIVEHDLIEFKDEVLQLARPIVSIKTEPLDESEIPVGDSKFGGQPDLPPDTEWPSCKAGPLGFLAQFALADLKYTQIGCRLPKDGVLSVFVYQSWNTGAQPGNWDCDNDTQLIYSPGSKKLARRNPPAGLDAEGNGIIQSCRLTMCEEWDLPSLRDMVPESHVAALQKLAAVLRYPDDRLHDMRVARESFGHHLMGYSVHFRTDDPTPGQEWTHVLCLDSDDNLGWSWCDGQNLSIWVHKDDLGRGKFDRIFAYAS
jgi:uncharacterized protein (TIGR02996 family)